MKIGYPCINLSIDCRGNKTFRLKSYTEKSLKATIENNLGCLAKILEYNVKNHIYFFRITSDLIPFASHPICTFPWQDYYQSRFEDIGSYITKHHMRISMHPDQFIILNARDDAIVKRSIDELAYHADVLDVLNLDATAKIQLHIGGVYGDKKTSMQRFTSQYTTLPQNIKQRLVIENDHQRYHLHDCIQLSKKISIPVLFDYFHHQVHPSDENFLKDFVDYVHTWSKHDGIPMCDYSSQQAEKPLGSHAYSIDLRHFSDFLELTHPYDIDIMLEIKDKEHSALQALTVARKDTRFYTRNYLTRNHIAESV